MTKLGEAARGGVVVSQQAHFICTPANSPRGEESGARTQPGWTTPHPSGPRPLLILWNGSVSSRSRWSEPWSARTSIGVVSPGVVVRIVVVVRYITRWVFAGDVVDVFPLLEIVGTIHGCLGHRGPHYRGLRRGQDYSWAPMWRRWGCAGGVSVRSPILSRRSSWCRSLVRRAAASRQAGSLHGARRTGVLNPPIKCAALRAVISRHRLGFRGPRSVRREAGRRCTLSWDFLHGSWR